MQGWNKNTPIQLQIQEAGWPKLYINDWLLSSSSHMQFDLVLLTDLLNLKYWIIESLMVKVPYIYSIY